MKLTKLLCAAVLALSTVASAEPTKIVIWHAYRGAERAAFEKVVAEYNKANAGKIQADTLAVPPDALPDKITLAVPRGKGPDVFIFAQDRLGGWVEATNTVEPIDFYLDDATKARALPLMFDAMTYHGTTYGLPLNYKVITMIYNKKLVSTPPKTTGELVKLAKKITDGQRFGLVYAYNDFYYHQILLNGFGGAVFASGAKPTLDAPANVKSFDLLLSWIDAGIVPKEPSTALITSLFNGGKAGIVFSGPWFLGEISQGIDFGLAPLPKIDEAKGNPMRPWATIEGVFVTAPSKNKEAAYDFAKYLTDTPAAKVMALEGRQCPSNKAVYDDPKVASDWIIKAFRQQFETAIPMANLAEMSVMWNPATIAIGSIVNRSVTPQAALESAQAKVVKDVAALRK
jgi:arabinogalactan oligomer/maltooligosaccharide transport system substrate-binding protein